MLKTRVKGFEALTSSLLVDNQTGAYRILQQGLVNQKGTLSDELNSIPLFTSILPAIDELLDDKNINVLIVSTPDVQLSLKRITDVGPDYLFLHDNKTRLSKRKLQSLEEETALVVPCDNLGTNLKRLEGSQTNVILLTAESDKDIEEAIVSYGQAIRVVKEGICWSNLTPQAQDIIFQKSVKFQNKAIHLKEISAEILPMDQVKGQIIFELLNGMCPELVKNSVPSSPPCYVLRKISSRVNLSPDVFQNAGDDVFVVEGIELHQLTNLTRKRNGEAVPVARSSEQRKTLTAQFIQLEHEEDYKDICKLSKTPVHLTSYKRGEVAWRKSDKSLGCIQEYIRDSLNTGENEDNFVQRCLASKSPICIADSPGMGKTLLLTRIAEKLMSECASEKCVVRFLILRDLIPEAQTQSEINLDITCELIAKSSSDFDIGRKIVIRALKSEKVKCHVFLDGYDELLSDQVNVANKMLSCLTELKNTQLYVSTRLHRCQELEKALITTGCRIQPFDEEDQVTFLTGYWNEAGAVKNDRLEEFAESCLGTLKKNMTKTERNIAGIPLQCRLLAELYSKEAKQYSEGRTFEPNKDSPVSTLFGLFQNFVDMSFEKVKKCMKERVTRAHKYYAIKLLFPAVEQECLTCEDDSILLVPGILEKLKLDEDPKFTHRTLAEFMVAHFVNECLKTTGLIPVERNIVCLVLRKLLSTTKRNDIVLKETLSTHNVLVETQVFEYSVICHFLNSFMLKTSVATAEPEAGGSACFTNTIPTRELSDIFTASVASNLPGIASFLTKLTNFNTECLSWSNLFLLAAKYAGTDLLDQLTTLPKQQRIQISQTKYYPVAKTYWANDDFIVTPLHVAVHWGNYNVTILLLNNHGCHDSLIQDNYKKTRYLLHACVRESYQDTEAVVNDKIQIIKCLFSEEEETKLASPYRHILEEKFADGSTPLLQIMVHPKLIQCLIQVGADVNAVNKIKECVLHTVIDEISGFNPTRFHELVESLTQTTFKHYDLKINYFGTPLRCSVKCFDIEIMRTVDLLLENGADINHVDQWGSSILFEGLRNARSKEFVREFAFRGANLTFEINGTRFVIPAAVMEAVEYVIETNPSSVNTFPRKKLHPDSREEHLECIINAKVELQEMENHHLPSFVLSLQTPSIPNHTTVEPCFVVHSLQSNIIDREWRSEEHDSWGLAFNYNKILQNNLLGDVAGCTAKVVLMNVELIDEIGKVFEKTGTYPIVGVEEIQLKDLPKQTQEIICSKKIGVRRKYNKFDAWTGNFPIEQLAIRGKLFDLSIEHRITLINREQAFYLDDSRIFDYGISSRRNISTSIFAASGDDVFVIQGSDLQQLSSLTQGQGMLTDKSSNQTSLLTARCIQLESEGDFGKICSLSKFPVHLLSYHEGNFSWVKSHGSVAVIQQHIHKQQQHFSLAGFLLDITRRRGCLTCLTYKEDPQELESAIVSVKNQICQNQRSSVFCLKINEEFVKNINASVVGPVHPFQFVAEMLSDYAHGRELLINCFQAAEVTVHLLFYCHYGFPIGQNEMLAIRKVVCHTKPQRNIRLHFIVESDTLSQMEEALQTLGYNLIEPNKYQSSCDSDVDTDDDSSCLDSSDSD